jgi:hypothetical protein
MSAWQQGRTELSSCALRFGFIEELIVKQFAIRIGLGIAALALFVSVMPGAVQADVEDGRTGAVRGIVVNADGEPVGGAHVRLVPVHHRRHVVARAVTERNGTFAVRGVPAGRYIARAALRDVGRGRARVAVHADEVSRVRIVIGTR